MAGKKQQEDSTAALVLWPLRHIKHLVVSYIIFGCIALALDVIAARKLWPADAGAARMENLIRTARDNQINSDLCHWFGEATLWVWFKSYGLYESFINYRSNGNQGEVTWTQKMIFAPFGSDLEIMFSGAYLYGCRLAGLVSSIPLYFLICAVAIVDGLVERSVRRACLGNESAALYHRAKFWSFRLLPPISAMAWLCLPFPIHPIAVIAPTALFTGILLRLQMKYYKKYF